ncbi:MAG: exo-alpha-sialidase [Ruminococcaceae bacterium]|nr:exo-alpha-sialidase [Oscillospiraceae bacterium]
MKIQHSVITGELKPGPGNPRNSEGSFLPISDGRIAFAYSRYHADSADDHADCDICAVYSYDNGETWDTENYVTLVKAEEYGEKNVMSVTLARMDNGDIGLYYLLKHVGITSDYILRRYGGDFSNPLGEVKCLPCGFPGYFVVNNDRVAHLADGTWVVPAAKHPSSIHLLEDGSQRYDGRGTVHFFVSRDDGRTWQQSWPMLQLTDSYSNSGLQEPGLIQLPGGTLYCYCRTDRMYQYETVSIDNGEHWFNPQPSRFTSPCSPMLIRQNPYSGKYYAVWNPVPEYMMREKSPVWTGGRNPLVMAESDDGVYFSAPVVLEEDPTRGFCYPAMYFLDEKNLLISYCSGGTPEGGCLNKTTLRKITLA